MDTRIAENVKLWCPFTPVEVVKSDTGDGQKRLLGKVRGIATVEVPDKVKGDIVNLDTIQVEYLLKSGFIIHEHPRGCMNTIGYPTSAKIVDYTTEDGKKTRALEVEGYIYLDDDVGAMIYHKASVMKAAGGDRQFGWSLEGPGVVRTAEIDNPVRVVNYHEPKAIAVCLEPAVEYALWEVAASATSAAAESSATLEDVLAKTIALRDVTQLCHWNVTGPTFGQLHDLFGEQYEELASGVDDIAERLRQQGAKISLPVAPAGSGPEDPTEMVVMLAKANTDLAAACNGVVRAAERAGDAATVDLIGRRAGVHEKAAWKLSSTASVSSARAFITEVAQSARVVNAHRGDEHGLDYQVALLLKSFPTLTWAQGEEFVGRIRSALHNVMNNKGNLR